MPRHSFDSSTAHDEAQDELPRALLTPAWAQRSRIFAF